MVYALSVQLSVSRLTLSQLRVLLATIDTGSLTAAASELGLSQSAVSHAIADLERELGAKLLERGRFGARATPLGERIVVHARTMLQAQRAMLEEVSIERNELRGKLRLASFRSVATHVLPDLVQQFCQQHPGVQFEIQSIEGQAKGIETAILEGRADIGILMPPIDPRLWHQVFAEDDWVAVFPNDYAPVTQKANWVDLEQLPFLLCNEAGAATVRAYWHEQGRIFQQVAQVEDDSVILSMVAHGFGISILAQLATLPVPDGVSLRDLPVALTRSIAVAATPVTRQGPVARAFIQMLCDPEAFGRCAAVKAQAVRAKAVH